MQFWFMLYGEGFFFVIVIFIVNLTVYDKLVLFWMYYLLINYYEFLQFFIDKFDRNKNFRIKATAIFNVIKFIVKILGNNQYIFYRIWWFWYQIQLKFILIILLLRISSNSLKNNVTWIAVHYKMLNYVLINYKNV